MRIHTRMRLLLILPVAFCCLLAGGAIHRAQDVCGPFTDVSPAFCPFVLEMYYLGITAGTSPTTFSPDAALTRGQAAVFVSKGVNQAIARSSRRAALGQWWTTTGTESLARTVLGGSPYGVQSDGADLWVADNAGGRLFRVVASDGRFIHTWNGATGAYAVLVAMGRVFVTGIGEEGKLYMVDPNQGLDSVTLVASGLGASATGIAFDGGRIWTANQGSDASEPSVSIITPSSSLP